MVFSLGTGIICTLRYDYMTGVTLGRVGWGGIIIEVSIVVACLGCNGTAPVRGSMIDGRQISVDKGRLRSLQRNNSGVCVVGTTGNREGIGCLFRNRGDDTLGDGCIDGDGCIGGDGTFGVAV